MSIGKIVHLLLIPFLFFGFCVAAAAQPRFSTIVKEKRPALDEYVEVEYTVQNASSVQRIAPPSFKKFRVIQGPVQSNGMTYMNGIMSQFRSVSFILQPLSTGIQVVPGASAIVEGKAMRSEPVVLEVREKGTGSGKIVKPLPVWPHEEPQIEEEFMLRPGESVAAKIKKNLLVKSEVNKTTCYEGEPIIASFKLASRLRSESKVLKRPSLNGFSVFDMIEPESNNPSVEMINGKPFNVHVIRKAQLFPLQAGTFDIDPVELENKVKFFKRSESNSRSRGPVQRFLDEYINQGARGNVEEHTFTLASKPLTIIVKPLPEENKPAGFNGAVGKFTMHASLKDSTVSAGEAIGLEIEIKGAGNFTLINPIALQLPGGIEFLDPEIHENVDKTVYPLQGSKTFEYTLMAKDTGDYLIPGVTFAYFDPELAKYRIERSDTFSVHVAPAAHGLTGKKITSVIRHPSASSWRSAMSFSAWMASAAAAFLVLLTAVFVWLRKRRIAKRIREAAVVPESPPAVPAIMEDPLLEAKLALEHSRPQQFYGEINKAVWKKINELIPMPATRLNKFNAVNILKEKGVDDKTTLQFESVLNACELALYAPVHTTTDMQQTLEKAAHFFQAVDEQVSSAG